MADTHSLTADEQEYIYPPPPPPGSRNLWVAEPGGVPEALIRLSDRFHETVKLGAEAPSFTGRTADGNKLGLSEYRGNRIVCLIFGSLSDPPLISNLNVAEPSINGLYRRFFAQGVQFVFIYTKESHPAEGIGQHSSYEQKLAQANLLRREEGILFPMVVDELDGRIHRAYGAFTNGAVIVNRAGIVIAKSLLIDTGVLAQALDDAVAWDRMDDGQTVIKKGYHERIYMCRAPYDPACRDRERQALERNGASLIEKIRKMAGFDPLTWRRSG